MWQVDSVEIIIDKLMMGDYIHTKGSKRTIMKITKKIGFDFKNRILKSRWELRKGF